MSAIGYTNVTLLVALHVQWYRNNRHHYKCRAGQQSLNRLFAFIKIISYRLGNTRIPNALRIGLTFKACIRECYCKINLPTNFSHFSSADTARLSPFFYKIIIYTSFVSIHATACKCRNKVILCFQISEGTTTRRYKVALEK